MLTELSGNTQLSAAMAREIHDRAAAGESQSALAREYCVNRSTIHRIATEQIWCHLWGRLPNPAKPDVALRASGFVVVPPLAWPRGAKPRTALSTARTLLAQHLTHTQIITRLISMGYDQLTIQKTMRRIARTTKATVTNMTMTPVFRVSGAEVREHTNVV